MNIGAETPDAFAAEAQIHGFIALQFLTLRGRHQRQQQISRVFRGERRTVGLRKDSADAQSDRHIGDQQQIGCALADGVGERVQRSQIRGGHRLGLSRSRSRAVQLCDNSRQFVFVTRHVSSMIQIAVARERATVPAPSLILSILFLSKNLKILRRLAHE